MKQRSCMSVAPGLQTGRPFFHTGSNRHTAKDHGAVFLFLLLLFFLFLFFFGGGWGFNSVLTEVFFSYSNGCINGKIIQDLMSLDKSKQENDIKNCCTYNCYESFLGKFCRTVGSSVLSPVQ